MNKISNLVMATSPVWLFSTCSTMSGHTGAPHSFTINLQETDRFGETYVCLSYDTYYYAGLIIISSIGDFRNNTPIVRFERIYTCLTKCVKNEHVIYTYSYLTEGERE